MEKKSVVIIIHRVVFWSTCFFLATGIFGCYANEVEKLVPTLSVKEDESSSNYYALIEKWSIEKSLNSVIVKVTYIDPEVAVASVEYNAEKEAMGSIEGHVDLYGEKRKQLSSEEKKKKKIEALNLCKKYLLFRISIMHTDNPNHTKITNPNESILLIDELGNKHLPEKVEEGEAEFKKKGFASFFYQRDYDVYFSKYWGSNSKPVLTEDTKWMKIELAVNGTRKGFKWVFSQEEGSVERSPYYFYPYLKASIVILLILLIGLVWVTSPSKGLQKIKR